jgi:Tol biopolymer transport system component/DNA-binding winged helix-turn-helix (wHTH) protein
MSPVLRYAFGDVELDPGRVLLLRDGHPLTLEPKAFAVLQLLVERAPRVVDKAEIFASVWKDTAVTDNALTRIVTQLRKALGDDAREPRFIATVATRGYRLLPAVRRIDDAAAIAGGPADAAPHATARTPAPPARPATGVTTAGGSRAWVVAFAAALMTLVAAAGIWVATRGPEAAAAGRRGDGFGDLDVAVAATLTPSQLTTATGFDGYVAFSPDGTSIAYSSDRSGALEIYVEGLAEGSTPTSLTRGAGQAIQPAWSPDGRFIAYHDLAGDGLWLVPSRGGAARKIADTGAHPAWSPDGTRIAFQSRSPADLNQGGSLGAESTIWILDVDGRTPARPLTRPGEPLGSHGMPQWWPGSTRIAFAVAPPAGMFLGAAIWTVDAVSGDLRRLGAHPRLTSEFAIAPDGRGLLFAARDTMGLWWLPVENGATAGEPRPTALPVIGPGIAGLALSADGRRVAWTSIVASAGIWAAGRPDAAELIVPPSDVGVRAGNPTVAADGRIAFMGNRGNAGNRIFLVVPGGPPRQITTDATNHFSPAWIDGQDALAVLANHGDGLAWWRLDPHTGQEQRLFAVADVRAPAGAESFVIGPSGGMALSPDLRRVAIAYIHRGVPNLWVAGLGNGGLSGPLRQLTREAVSGAFGSWSHDGRSLAYQCRRDADTQICVADADGTRPPRTLTTEPGTNFIGEWIGSEQVLFAGRERGIWNVRSVAAATGAVAALTAFDQPRFYVRYPRWDPARRRVVFERHETAGRVWSLQLPPPSVTTTAGSPASVAAR